MPHKDPEARNAWRRQWRAKNAARLAPQVREQVRRWRAANLERARELARESQRRWRAANPELSRKRSTESAARLRADPVKREQWNEYRRDWKSEWRAANPELSREQDRAYRRQNTAHYLWAVARKRSKKRSVEFTITREWAESRWTGKCELSGLDFVLHDGRPGPLSASLDRIDSSKGYTPDNCRFILWALNRFKNENSDAEIIAIARALIASIDS